jgi:hypothetical protein
MRKECCWQHLSGFRGFTQRNGTFVQCFTLGMKYNLKIKLSVAIITTSNRKITVPRYVYTLAGVFTGLVVNIVANLLSAAIQQQVFSDKFNRLSTWWLVGCLVVGALIGWWLGEKIQLKPQPGAQTQTTTGSPTSQQPTFPQQTNQGTTDKVTMTRLNALLSYGELKGKGINLSDILIIGSVIKVDTRD